MTTYRDRRIESRRSGRRELGRRQAAGLRAFGASASSLLLVAALLAVALTSGGCTADASYQWNGQLQEPANAAPPLEGVNWNGEPFDLGQLEGKVAVVFFGYTFCPDVCPFTLYKLKQVYAQLGDRADDVAVVFVSVDPHRDTVEKLAEYVPNFDQRFYGLRLEFDELDQVSDDWDLTVQYGQPKDGPGTDSYYYVDHTGTFFLIDREGRMRLTFPPNVTAEEMVPDLEALLAS